MYYAPNCTRNLTQHLSDKSLNLALIGKETDIRRTIAFSWLVVAIRRAPPSHEIAPANQDVKEMPRPMKQTQPDIHLRTDYLWEGQHTRKSGIEVPDRSSKPRATLENSNCPAPEKRHGGRMKCERLQDNPGAAKDARKNRWKMKPTRRVARQQQT